MNPLVNPEVIVDTVFIELPVSVSANLVRPHLFSSGEVDLLLTYDYFGHNLEIFNLTEKTYLRTVTLQQEGPDFIESVGAMTVLGEDSILVAGLSYLSLLDFEGKVLDRFRFNSDNTEFDGVALDRLELGYNQYSGLQFSPTRNSVLMQVNSLERVESQKYRGDRVAEINLGLKKVESFGGKIPEDYASVKGAYGNLTSVGFFRLDEGLIYNFPMSSDIFVNSEGKVRRYSPKSQFTDNLATPISDFSQGGDAARMVHQARSVYYLPVYQDPYSKFYYRLHKSSVMSIDDQPEYFLMVMDKDFNVLQEIPFPWGYYAFPIVSKEGLMFMAFNKHDDKLELIRYRFNQ